jgi:hypothetical protein
MSSSFSYLDNQNKKFRATFTGAPFTTSTTSFMVSCHPIPSFCRIDKITLISDGSPSTAAINLTVLNDGAGWTAASGNDAKAPFIVSTASANFANGMAVFSFTGGIYYEDAFRTNCLYLNFSNNSFSNGDTFTFIVEGVQMAPYTVADYDQTPFAYDNTWRILRVDANNVCTDLTQQLRRNGNPYGIGSTIDNSESFVAFDTASDYLYIGSEKPWSKAMIYVPSYSQNQTNIAYTYYNGSTWVSKTVLDNTSDGMATPSALTYSGVIEIENWTSAVPTTLSFDPLTVLQTSYDNFALNIPRPGGFFINPKRYWLRLKFSAITPSDLKLVGILPLK